MIEPKDTQDDADYAYSVFVDQLFVNRSHGVDGLVHAAFGISGEAGEILDAVKKNWVYNKPLDTANLIEEIGDIEFYLMALRLKLGVSRTQCLNANVEKLRVRYPEGYSDYHAAARLDKKESQ